MVDVSDYTSLSKTLINVKSRDLSDAEKEGMILIREEEKLTHDVYTVLYETNVSPQQAIFVTDTLGDINEANTLDIASFAVTWGFQCADTLAQGVPFGFAHEPSHINVLIDEYFADLS